MSAGEYRAKHHTQLEHPGTLKPPSAANARDESVNATNWGSTYVRVDVPGRSAAAGLRFSAHRGIDGGTIRKDVIARGWVIERISDFGADSLNDKVGSHFVCPAVNLDERVVHPWGRGIQELHEIGVDVFGVVRQRSWRDAE
jgi:hypothetical protein